MLNEFREEDEEIKIMSAQSAQIGLLGKLSKGLKGLSTKRVGCPSRSTHRRWRDEFSILVGDFSPEGGSDGICGGCSKDCSHKILVRDQLQCKDRKDFADIKDLIDMLKEL